jgi:hypothetical protein
MNEAATSRKKNERNGYFSLGHPPPKVWQFIRYFGCSRSRYCRDIILGAVASKDCASKRSKTCSNQKRGKIAASRIVPESPFGKEIVAHDIGK